ncbi:MAG: tetratricopeptide repeat protein [Thermoguttaceae bacterium]|nr:tetratricopeptide repeat protein [Thermoguttaceae bacterium]
MAAVAWCYSPWGWYPRGLEARTLRDPSILDPNDPLQSEAVKLADQLVHDFPDEVEALFIRGLILNKFVSRDEASRCWEACVRHQPDYAEPYYWLGRELFKKGEYEQAVAHLRKAVELNAPQPDVRIQLADALLSLNRADEALPVLHEQIRLAPDETAGFFYLGQAYFALDQLDLAAEHYRQALDLNPGCHQAWHGLARICQRRGQAEKSREYLRRFRVFEAKFFARHQETKRRTFGDEGTLEGTLATAYIDAGRLYYAREQLDSAEICWRRAGELDPRNAESRVLLVGLCQEQDRAADVVALLEELRRVEPANPIHALALGSHYAALGQYDRAEKELSQVIAIAPERGEGYAALADLYLRTGRKVTEAAPLARKAVALQPVAENYFVLARACAKAGDRAGTLTAISRAVELDPGNPEYQRFRDQCIGGPKHE